MFEDYDVQSGTLDSPVHSFHSKETLEKSFRETLRIPVFVHLLCTLVWGGNELLYGHGLGIAQVM